MAFCSYCAVCSCNVFFCWAAAKRQICGRTATLCRTLMCFTGCSPSGWVARISRRPHAFPNSLHNLEVSARTFRSTLNNEHWNWSLLLLHYCAYMYARIGEHVLAQRSMGKRTVPFGNSTFWCLVYECWLSVLLLFVTHNKAIAILIAFIWPRGFACFNVSDWQRPFAVESPSLMLLRISRHAFKEIAKTSPQTSWKLPPFMSEEECKRPCKSLHLLAFLCGSMEHMLTCQHCYSKELCRFNWPEI